MKKIKTNSYFVTIYKFKNKIVVKRRKRKGLHAYPRTLTLKEINNYLRNRKIKYPKILWNSFNFVYEEYIESTQDIKLLSKNKIIENVTNIIINLNKINVNNKKIKWKNNSEFLKFNIQNFKEVLILKNPIKLNEYLLELDKLYKKLDDKRKLCLIHGDIHKKNMIIHNDEFYLIDWELATYGDLAYELATHFILMEYTTKEKELIFNKLFKHIDLNIEKLMSDVEIYTNFELYRRKVLNEIKEL